MKKNWWKILSCLLILYSIIAGFSIKTPSLEVIGESIRNLFYHVPMWFAMIAMLVVSLVFSLKFLASNNRLHDLKADMAVSVALFFGITGIITGMIWAKFTWGSIWVNDPKLNGAAVGILAYLAYKVLRSSLNDYITRGRIAAVYSIFAFTVYIVFIFILPKISGNSIHPGAEKSMLLAPKTIDPNLRLVFYPAVLGWILFAYWMFTLLFRIQKIKNYTDGY